MSFVLGLDSGGTKTLAVISDQRGNVLKRWDGPGFDPMAGDAWRDELAEAVDQLCGGREPAAAVFGLPCHGETATITQMQRFAVRSVIDCPHLVLNDVEIACDGAFAGSDGVLVLAGTGSMAWAKVNGGSLRIGGWGDAFGDEGSALWIGRQALSLASQALDGRADAATFATAILSACGVGADGLIDWAYGQSNRRAAFAALAKTVSDLADAGNIAAIEMLKLAAQHLAGHAKAARRRLGRPDLAWSHAGGVFHSRQILDETSLWLGQPVVPKLPPVGGALFRAAGLAGWKADAGFIRSLAASLQDNQQ